MVAVLFAIIYQFIFPLLARSETFTSVFHLTNLLQQRISDDPQYHLSSNIEKQQRIKCNLGALVNESGMSVRQLSEHPVAAFHVIKCLTVVEPDSEFQQDLNGAALSLVRLQESYDLNIDNIMNGQIGQFKSKFSLSAADCVLVARQAFFDMRLDAAQDWLEHCSNATTSETSIGWINQSQRSSASVLKESVARLKEYINALQDFSRSPGRVKEILNLLPELTQAAEPIFDATEEIKSLKKNLTTNTNLLCQGFEPPWVNKTRRGCVHKKHPNLYYPILIEYVNDEPEVLLYHKIISKREIEKLKTMASHRLETSRIHRFSDGKVQTTTGRVGKIAWLQRGYHELIDRLYNRAELYTGLSTKTAEDLQIMNYGLGGHYENHMDFFDANRNINLTYLRMCKQLVIRNKRDISFVIGDRIATVLFYLNNVEYGGETVFTSLGITVPPTEGSALMWFNLDTDGLGDFRTLHAACPVVIGTKWVANLWLREREQEFRRPCLPRPAS